MVTVLIYTFNSIDKYSINLSTDRGQIVQYVSFDVTIADTGFVIRILIMDSNYMKTRGVEDVSYYKT